SELIVHLSEPVIHLSEAVIYLIEALFHLVKARLHLVELFIHAPEQPCQTSEKTTAEGYQYPGSSEDNRAHCSRHIHAPIMPHIELLIGVLGRDAGRTVKAARALMPRHHGELARTEGERHKLRCAGADEQAVPSGRHRCCGGRRPDRPAAGRY